jgi:hypothetical protein
MTGKDGVERVRIQNSGFDELEDAAEILGATELKRESDQMLGGHHPGRDVINLGVDSLGQRLLPQGVAGREKLNLPTFDDDVFPLDLTPTGGEIVVNRPRVRREPGWPVLSDTKTSMSRVAEGSR